eukprot:31033-Pelagococcus_subviridis.AAC.9
MADATAQRRREAGQAGKLGADGGRGRAGVRVLGRRAVVARAAAGRDRARALGFVPRQRRGHRVRARGAVREFTRQRTAGVRAGDGDDGGFSSERAAGDGGAWEHREGDDAGGRGSGGGGRRGQSVN